MGAKRSGSRRAAQSFPHTIDRTVHKKDLRLHWGACIRTRISDGSGATTAHPPTHPSCLQLSSASFSATCSVQPRSHSSLLTRASSAVSRAAAAADKAMPAVGPPAAELSMAVASRAGGTAPSTCKGQAKQTPHVTSCGCHFPGRAWPCNFSTPSCEQALHHLGSPTTAWPHLPCRQQRRPPHKGFRVVVHPPAAHELQRCSCQGGSLRAL